MSINQNAQTHDGPSPEGFSWAKALVKLDNQARAVEEAHNSGKTENTLVIFHVGTAASDDSREVSQNNMKIFTSAMAEQKENADVNAMYIFNVVGAKNPLESFVPASRDNVAVVHWESASSDMLTHIRTLEMLGQEVLDSFDAILFFNQGVRGPFVHRENGAWIQDYTHLLRENNVAMVGSTISCEVTPHVQTHAFAVRPVVFPFMSALLGDTTQRSWVETVRHFEVDLSVAVKAAGYNIASLLHYNRAKQPFFMTCLEPKVSTSTVLLNPTSWCDIKTEETVFTKWGGEPLRTNGYVCDEMKTRMQEDLKAMSVAVPALHLTVPETLKGGLLYDMYKQYQREMWFDAAGNSRFFDAKAPAVEESAVETRENVCFLVRAYDTSSKQSQFVDYGIPGLVASLLKQSSPNWMAVFINTDNSDYFTTLNKQIAAFADPRLRTIDVPAAFRPKFTVADAGYTATDYAMEEMKQWARCKFISVSNSDNVYGTKIVEEVLSAKQAPVGAEVLSTPDMVLVPLDSRNFAYSAMAARSLLNAWYSRCTEIKAVLEFSTLAATSSPVPVVGKVDLAGMFFDRAKLASENIKFNDVASVGCPGCQDGYFAEYLAAKRLWNYVRLPIAGLESVVFHGPSPSLCIAAGNVWFDHPKVNNVGCLNHSQVLDMQNDPTRTGDLDWENYYNNGRICLRVTEPTFVRVVNGEPLHPAALTVDEKIKSMVARVEAAAGMPDEASMLQLAGPTKRTNKKVMGSTLGPSIMPTESPTDSPTAAPTQAPITSSPSAAPTQAPSAAPTVVPSAHPSAQPTVAPSAAPTNSSAPTVAPTPSPTAATNTLTRVDAFCKINGANNLNGAPTAAPTLMPAARRLNARSVEHFAATTTVNPFNTPSDLAIITTVAGLFQIPLSNVIIDSETDGMALVGGKNVSSVLVAFHLFVSASDFPNTTFTGSSSSISQQIFTLVVNSLNTSMSSGQFRTNLIANAVALNATQLLSVLEVSLTGTPTYSQVNSVNTNNNNNLSTGDFAGIVIGVIVVLLVIVFLFYWFVVREKRSAQYDENAQNINLEEGGGVNNNGVAQNNNGEMVRYGNAGANANELGVSDGTRI